jgi:hypothetical protein
MNLRDTSVGKSGWGERIRTFGMTGPKPVGLPLATPQRCNRIFLIYAACSITRLSSHGVPWLRRLVHLRSCLIQKTSRFHKKPNLKSEFRI